MTEIFQGTSPARIRIAMIGSYPASAVLPSEILKPKYRQLDEHAAPWIRSLCRELIEIPGFDVHVFSLSRAVSDVHTVTIEGFPVTVVPHRFPQRFDWCHSFRLNWLQLRQHVRAFNPHLVHAFGLETGNATIAGYLGYLSTCFVQGIIQKYAPFLEHCSPAHLHVLERLERQAVPRMKGFVAENEFAREWVLSVDPQANVVIIPHAVNREFMEQGIPDFEQCRFLSVGSIDSRKGMEPLIRAFARASYPARRLTIVGDGPFLKACRELASSLGVHERVEFTGAVSRKEIIRLMTHSRALVLAARMDTSPNVITEAHSIGLPVLATRAGGIPEMIDEGRDGFLVDVDDLEAMADRIDLMAAAPELCCAMGSAGRLKVMRVNDSITVASAHAEFFRRIVSEYGEAVDME